MTALYPIDRTFPRTSQMRSRNIRECLNPLRWNHGWGKLSSIMTTAAREKSAKVPDKCYV